MTGFRPLLLASLLGCLGCSGTEETPVFGPGPDLWTQFDPAWNTVYPANGSERLLAACAMADGEAWAVGTGGVIVRHAGARWMREESDTGATLADVATDGQLVCAVGSNGAIVVREAGHWCREASGTTRALRAVAVLADGTAWAGGEAGILLRREDGVWRPVALESGGAAVTSLAAWGDTLVVGNAAGVVFGQAATGGRVLGAFAGGVLRLACAPGGTLFAAADSLYRYDCGRWIGLISAPDSRLAANDSLVYSGHVAMPHDYNSWRDGLLFGYAVSLSDELAVICPVGPTGALAVGLHGTASWLRDGAWHQDVDGGGARAVVSLADGTICALLDNQAIAWEGGRWRTVCQLPFAASDTLTVELLDGLDRSRLLVRVNSDLLLGGETWQVVPLPSGWPSEILIDGAGVPVASDSEGLLAWSGQEWRREFTNQDGSSGRFYLARSRAGDLFAVNERRVLLRGRGRWREVALFTGDRYLYDVAAVGRFPDSFALCISNSWLSWDARADSVQNDWRTYATGAYAYAWYETVGAVYALDGNLNRILRLPLRGPGAGTWEAVTGSVLDSASDVWVESDGAIMVQGAFGRIWRHPAPPRI